MSTESEVTKVSRRSFLCKGVGACVVFIGAVLGVPAIGAAVGPAFKRTEAGWIQVGRVDSFPENIPTPAEFSFPRRDGWLETIESKAVWVVRRSGNEFVVFNGRCTHLGCAYRWQSDKGQFICPCHAGVFAEDGSVLSGPPPRGLDTLPVRVEADNLLVQYFDFRLGVAEKVPS